jgi:hypothetical protein
VPGPSGNQSAACEPDTAAARDHLLEAWLQLARQANANLPPEPYFPTREQAPFPAVLPEELASDLTANPIAWFTAERTSLLTAVDHACQTTADRESRIRPAGARPLRAALCG